MGMFDDVKCDMAMPDGRLPAGSWFQTKSLYRCMDRFTITAGGRLIFHRYKQEPAGTRINERTGAAMPRYEAKHVEDIDMEYHGDIRIYARTPDNTLAEYAVRFTHGTLEWIKPFETLSETHKEQFDTLW